MASRAVPGGPGGRAAGSLPEAGARPRLGASRLAASASQQELAADQCQLAGQCRPAGRSRRAGGRRPLPPLAAPWLAAAAGGSRPMTAPASGQVSQWSQPDSQLAHEAASATQLAGNIAVSGPGGGKYSS